MRWKPAHVAHDLAETITSSLFTTKSSLGAGEPVEKEVGKEGRMV